MSTVHVTARLQAHPGKGSGIVDHAAPLIESTRKEDGCLRYDLMRSDDSPDLFIFIEEWATKEALEKHLATAHIDAFRNNTAASIKTADVTTWHAAPVQAGNRKEPTN